MIRFENTVTPSPEQWKSTILGARNAMNSWEKSDSGLKDFSIPEQGEYYPEEFVIGPNDLDLMKRLRNAGTDHRKFMRMITVYVDITAPLYWWKEFDTYKVGTVANSCSTMHKIHEKEFTMGDFSCEHLDCRTYDLWRDVKFLHSYCSAYDFLKIACDVLNHYRKIYLETKDKKYWWQMIQLLPTSYNQKRTVMLNYEVLANIYKSRKNHKLDEWCEHSVPERSQDPIADGYRFAKSIDALGFCDWIKRLPYSELITGEE